MREGWRREEERMCEESREEEKDGEKRRVEKRRETERRGEAKSGEKWREEESPQAPTRPFLREVHPDGFARLF